MSRKLELPALAPPFSTGYTSGGDSRPSSSSSTSTCTMVPHILYNDTKFPITSRSCDIPSSRSILPSLKDRPHKHEGRHSTSVLYEPRSRYSLYRRSTCKSPSTTASTPFLPKSSPEECIKCLMKLPHRKCESHKYIRVGGGYRHSYWYVKLLMEELELQIQRQAIQKQRLAAIKEIKVRAIKTRIRTKSGRLVERIVYLDDEDYEAFRNGGKAFQKKILEKYLSESDRKGLQTWDKDEVKAVKTFIRTKSGRLKERLVYISKKEYDDIKSGKVKATDIINKYVKIEEGEEVEGWEEAQMKTITTYVRTKSGKIKETVIMISKEDYDAMIRDGKDPSEVIAKYLPLGDGEKIESWKNTEPMKSIKTTIRTKSGRLIEKTVLVSKEDYEEMIKKGGDPSAILSKYIAMEDGETLETWQKSEPSAMKVIKTIIRTKSGKLREKIVMLSEEEYREFERTGGDPEFLKRFIDLGKDDVIADWDKASTVFDASDEEYVQGAEKGEHIRGSDGNIYEIVVDPLTGKKYKKKVTLKDSDVDSGIASLKQGGDNRQADGKGRRVRGKGGEFGDDYLDETPVERSRRKVGKRAEGSESDFSYTSVVSAGGGRHVKRRHKKKDGTHSASESYHSSGDEDGQERRRRRRRERQHGSASSHSYRSVVSAGGTKHVKRRRKKADGTFSASESYHSSDSGMEGGGLQRGGKKGKQKRRRSRKVHGSDSENSYRSEVSEGGTKRRVRLKRVRDKDGKVIGHGKAVDYVSSCDEESDSDLNSVYTEISDGAGGRVRVKKDKPVKKGKGKNRGKRRGKKEGDESDSDDDDDDDDEDEDEDDDDSTDENDEDDDEGIGGKKKRKGKGRGKKGNSESDDSDDVAGDGKNKKGKKGKHTNDSISGSGSEYVDDDGVLRKKDKNKRRDDKNKKAKQGKGKKTRVLEDGTVVIVSDSSSDDSPGVFSDVSTESEAVDLSTMTEEEKAEYLQSKAKRKEAREKKRREKYGEAYDELAKKHTEKKKEKKEKALRKKEEKEKYKSMVSYEKMTGRENGRVEQSDGREAGLGHTQWGTKKGNKLVDGNEADDESEEEEYMEEGKKIKRTKKKLADGRTENFVYEYDDQGNITKKKRIITTIDGEEEVCSEYEYEYNEDGELVEVKRVDRPDSAQSDGDYFEKDADGKVTLKKGKRRIDLSKLNADELRELGIDPNLSKQAIARLLKEQFGDDILINEGNKKIGTKRLEEYGSDVGTDDLADDSDLDTSTLKGLRRVKVMMKKGGDTLLSHMRRVMDDSDLHEDASKTLDERDGDIDFLAHYKLVDKTKIDGYARAFVVEDEDFDTVISAVETKTAIEGVATTQSMTNKQMEYVLKVLQIDEASRVTFRMFAVITALCERVTEMDSMSKHLLEICDLLDIERKMGLYRSMFYCNTNSDRDANFITADSLKIDLIAGGLNWVQQAYVMEKLHPNEFNEISFLDYLCYIPLFMSMHDNICQDPLDMSNNKYTQQLRRPSGTRKQRDVNPLGFPLKKESSYQMRTQAQDLLEGRVDPKTLTTQKIDMLNKYAKLPDILSTRPAGPSKSPTLDWG